MQRYIISEPPDASLRTLADAMDLMDVGVVLLDRDLRARFINPCFVEMWQIPPALLASGPSYRDLLNYGTASGCYPVLAADAPAYIDGREAEVRSGTAYQTLLILADRRQLLFGCVASSDGGRILTYTDISQELRQEASSAMERTSAELRFNSEMLEEQGAHLAALAEAAEESAQRADAARGLLEHEITERRQLEIKLRQLATTDGLTGVLNRSEFLASAEREMDARKASEPNMVVLMIDVDHFKAVNDRFGHAGGDRALTHLVTTLRAGLRQIDLLGRVGGEEFGIVLLDTPLMPAEMVAERLRARVAEVQIAFADRLISMTISIGLAVQLDTDQSIEQVLARADDALYQAKRSGRNRVVVHEIQAA
jgi:diguanylate cyclase (GGDEF)-like protein